MICTQCRCRTGDLRRLDLLQFQIAELARRRHTFDIHCGPIALQITRSQLRSSGRYRNGFSLIDVTLTVLITGILASAATPAFSGFLQHARADAAAKRIRADLDHARRTALAESQTRAVRFSVGTGIYTLPGMTHPDHPGQTYSVDLSLTPYSSTIQSVSAGSDTTIMFSRFGASDSGGVITVQSGLATQTVTVDPDTGKASVP